MIFADKMIQLRKKAGWSQEELAAQLNVSRQSVSKWEGAQSTPDMNRIVQLSRIFGVSTDYLLKDDLEEAEPLAIEGEETEGLRVVTMEEASSYLELRRAAAPKMAFATFLCVVSPIALMLLAAMSEGESARISENVAAGLGLAILLVMVAAGVALFLSCASKSQDFSFLEKEPIETAYGVTGMVRERRAAFRETYSRLNILGTTLCILSAVPLFASLAVQGSDVLYVAMVCALLFTTACGCFAFVYGGVYQSAMNKLLEEGEYARAQKAKRSVTGPVSAVYWLAVTAVYIFLVCSPVSVVDPQKSWFIWPVAGVLYAALLAALKLKKPRG